MSVQCTTLRWNIRVSRLRWCYGYPSHVSFKYVGGGVLLSLCHYLYFAWNDKERSKKRESWLKLVLLWWLWLQRCSSIAARWLDEMFCVGGGVVFIGVDDVWTLLATIMVEILSLRWIGMWGFCGEEDIVDDIFAMCNLCSDVNVILGVSALFYSASE